MEMELTEDVGSVTLTIRPDVARFVAAMEAVEKVFRQAAYQFDGITWAMHRGATARTAYHAKTRRRNRRG